MIPECFSAYRSLMPVLDEAIEWSLLRKWSLSEVYRATLASGETRIMKWGRDDMAGEAAIYKRLVGPLNIKAPYIFGYFEVGNSAVMVMEDRGSNNLEQQPHSDYFLEAARELARIRTIAADNLELNIPGDMIRLYTVSAANFLTLLDDLLRSNHFSDNSVLSRLQTTFPCDLHTLYDTLPLTLVHHDYHAKNLLIQGSRILPIDWAIGYLSPHLGDLYCLIKEARAWSHVSRADMLAAFLHENGTDLSIAQLN
ncbi:hypothetical protein PAECIP111893_01158 [Paenibacillus plantiphilus]|uniref:Aminoglycoside phosphotransferase domain-containing protein n=1 Tax=Paenibacillus plantiphilus TaxID=2905650 RepID=A0ABN8G7N9_9BACL|nr:phosphotransferase [Paenibacillus plantiphilus]CAH1198900.1 hypothetical protein PAECIP111893_01158 [Paenibacillus plantiphilus]